MQLLNIIQCTNLGGMEQASLRLMRAMMPLGIRSEVISLHPIGGLGALMRDLGIPHQGLNYWGPAGVGVIAPLVTRLKSSRGSRVVMTGPHLAAMIAMKLAGVRGSFLAVHFHHTGVKLPSVWRLLYRIALDRFQWVTFPSNFVRNEALELCPSLEKRSFVIRLPLDPCPLVTEEGRMVSRKMLGLSERDFVVGNAGWLIPRKRFDVFLRVAAEVAARKPGAVFLIAGGGEDEQSLRNLAVELGIAGKIRWLGWLADLTNFQNSLDVLLFNADWDALPVTPQEMVAHGVPIVASLSNGGLREVFDATLARRILPTHDVAALADQILAIHHNPALARQQAMASRRHFLNMSNPDAIAQAHLDLLNSSS